LSRCRDRGRGVIACQAAFHGCAGTQRLAGKSFFERARFGQKLLDRRALLGCAFLCRRERRSQVRRRYGFGIYEWEVIALFHTRTTPVR
jgi:hypothetical protein